MIWRKDMENMGANMQTYKFGLHWPLFAVFQYVCPPLGAKFVCRECMPHTHTIYVYIQYTFICIYIYTYIISHLASFSCPQWNVQERSKDGGRSAVRPEMAASANAVPLQGRIPPKLQRMPKGVMSPENVAK